MTRAGHSTPNWSLCIRGLCRLSTGCSNSPWSQHLVWFLPFSSKTVSSGVSFSWKNLPLHFQNCPARLWSWRKGHKGSETKVWSLSYGAKNNAQNVTNTMQEIDAQQTKLQGILFTSHTVCCQLVYAKRVRLLGNGIYSVELITLKCTQ